MLVESRWEGASHFASVLEHQLLYLVESIPIGVWPREEASVLHSATQL